MEKHSISRSILFLYILSSDRFYMLLLLKNYFLLFKYFLYISWKFYYFLGNFVVFQDSTSLRLTYHSYKQILSLSVVLKLCQTFRSGALCLLFIIAGAMCICLGFFGYCLSFLFLKTESSPSF